MVNYIYIYILVVASLQAQSHRELGICAYNLVVVAVSIAIAFIVAIKCIFDRLQVELLWNFPGKFIATKVAVTRGLFIYRLVQVQITKGKQIMSNSVFRVELGTYRIIRPGRRSKLSLTTCTNCFCDSREVPNEKTVIESGSAMPIAYDT